MDWNDDGMKDLIVGERNGTIRIYLNTNKDEDPVFNGYTFLKLGTSNFDCGLNSHPFVADWNNDGLFDLIVGEDGGKVFLLINEGTQGSPVFNAKPYLMDGGSTLTTGNEASTAVVDWDRDGKKDLLCGNYYGNVYFWKNVGTDEDPQFNGKVYLKSGGANIDVHYYARIDVADWNNDGVVDLLSGNRYYDGTPVGGVWYFKANGPLSANTNFISESAGGMIRMNINAGSSQSNRFYMVFGTTSGTSPGTPLPGGLATLPINWDAFTNIVADVNYPESIIFTGFYGTLGSNGRGEAIFDTNGPVPGMSGYMVSFAYALNDPWDYASNALNIEIVP